MDLPFERRVLFYMTNGLLLAIVGISPIIILCPYLFAPIDFPAVFRFLSIAPVCGLLIPFILSCLSVCDLELTSTWRRNFFCISVLNIGIIFAVWLNPLLAYVLFPNGLTASENLILLGVYVLSCIDRQRMLKHYIMLYWFLCHAQQRFPNVERERLLKLAERAMRDGGEIFIDNYEFPAMAG